MNIRETSVTTEDDVVLDVYIYESEALVEERRPLVLLHGWPNSGRIWGEFAEAMLLADIRYQLIAPTFRGYGASDKPHTGYTVERFAKDIRFVAGVLALDRFALLGHSMGGKVAQKFAVLYPDLLSALALLSPAFATAGNVPKERRDAQRAIHGDPVKTRDLILGMVAHAPTERQMSSLMEDGLRTGKEAFDGWIETMREQDFATELTTIHTPTLVIHGAKDPLREESAVRTNVVERIPGASLSVLPSIGHLAHIEDPTTLALLLVNFLDRSFPAEVGR